MVLFCDVTKHTWPARGDHKNNLFFPHVELSSARNLRTPSVRREEIPQQKGSAPTWHDPRLVTHTHDSVNNTVQCSRSEQHSRKWPTHHCAKILTSKLNVMLCVQTKLPNFLPFMWWYFRPFLDSLWQSGSSKDCIKRLWLQPTVVAVFHKRIPYLQTPEAPPTIYCLQHEARKMTNLVDWWSPPQDNIWTGTGLKSPAPPCCLLCVELARVWEASWWWSV